MTLTPKQLDAREQRFVDEYLLDLDPKRAAVAAGYATTTAHNKSYGWVSKSQSTKPHVFEAIEKAQAARSERTEITQDWVLTNLHGTVERCLGEGDAFQPAAALKGLYLAGRHLGMFATTLKHTGDVGVALNVKEMSPMARALWIAAQLREAQERAKKVKEDADSIGG